MFELFWVRFILANKWCVPRGQGFVWWLRSHDAWPSSKHDGCLWLACVIDGRNDWTWQFRQNQSLLAPRGMFLIVCSLTKWINSEYKLVSSQNSSCTQLILWDYIFTLFSCHSTYSPWGGREGPPCLPWFQLSCMCEDPNSTFLGQNLPPKLPTHLSDPPSCLCFPK